MARLMMLTLVIIAMLICFSPCLGARKILNEKKETIMEGNLVKSTIATPTALSVKLFAIHLAHMDQILHSSPSPGAGH